MPRLFTGLEIPAEVRLALSAFRGGLPGARWVEPDNYHVTLRFIGDIDEGVAREVVAVLGEARARGPVEVTFEALDSFGGRRPRVVMARATATDDLAELQAENEQLLRRIGLPPEGKRFVPHVTLARLRDSSPRDVAGYIAMHGRFPKLSFTAERFILYSSRASVGGGPYVIEAAYPLT
ncbi:MAG TPA: RNA 2',3'-cyclic phosphodiesterase [Microvirga sp.]|nr:RNA 2',3'-cyclic phosphodiesterase [Microvirga sp.]